MGNRPTPEAAAVAEAFRHLGVDVDVDGDRIRHTATGADIDVHGPNPGPGSSQIVVRDRVTPAAARKLQEAGIGWLDLRGHLAFRSPALVIDAAVPGHRTSVSQRRAAVLAGAVVSGVTMVSLAAWPEPLDGVRSTARLLEVTAGGVSAACRRLQEAGLLTRDRRATAALFWAAADEWRPEWIDLPIDALPPGSDTVAVGAVAAARLGAPAAITTETVPEYLVATNAIIQYARLSARSDLGGPIGRYAVAPAPVATRISNGTGADVGGQAVANEAIVALSLAIDAARGAETVRSWEGPHVWN